jgi:uncharacterized protein YdcH (DUF465 family)
MDTLAYTNMVMDKVLGAAGIKTPAQEHIAHVARILDMPDNLREEIAGLEEDIESHETQIIRNLTKRTELLNDSMTLASDLGMMRGRLREKQERLKQRLLEACKLLHQRTRRAPTMINATRNLESAAAEK